MAEVFAEFRELGRVVTRLHPRRGDPGVWESSVGGPLVWPVGESWPTCPGHQGVQKNVERVADVRAARRIRRDRFRSGRELTSEEREFLDSRRRESEVVVEQPVPLLPLLQVFARDVPWLEWPAGRDVLQVLMCPMDHLDEPDFDLPGVSVWDHGMAPPTVVRWRSTDSVGAVGAHPMPSMVQFDHYYPEPCVLFPERLVEYPHLWELPEDLAEAVEEWEEISGYDYRSQLSNVPGWVLGGWPEPGATDPPDEMACTECGGEMRPLLRISRMEWDVEGVSWCPIEEFDRDPADREETKEPTGVMYGADGTLHLYRCWENGEHPLQQMAL